MADPKDIEKDMLGNDKHRALWAERRPNLPYPLIDGTNTSWGLEIFLDPSLWGINKDVALWVQSQDQLCGYWLPPFQRPIVWDEARMVALVESAYLGIHLGTIVINDASHFPLEGGRFHRTDRWLIDGQQRLTALSRYVSGAFPVFIGTPYEHHWHELNKAEQHHFMFIQIGVTKIQSNDEHQLRTTYDRLNFGGVAHTEDQRALANRAD